MITSEDVVAVYPQANGNALLQHWVDVANVAIDAARVKDVRTLPQAQMLFVMHHIEKPALNLKAAHVVARTANNGRRGASVKFAHPWAGTPHGSRLMAATKY
jgi:hypothetical protein